MPFPQQFPQLYLPQLTSHEKSKSPSPALLNLLRVSTPQNAAQTTFSCSRENWWWGGRRSGKKHAMQHPLQFRAIHVNNCFLFQWKCTARQGKQYFLPIKRKKLDRQASDRLSKDKTQINLFLRKQALFMIWGNDLKLHF